MKMAKSELPQARATPPQREKGGPGPVAPGALWQVLQRQAALYTGTDSSSLPVEVAGELLYSVLFCLKAAEESPQNGGLPPAEGLLAGQRVLYGCLGEGKRLFARVKPLHLPGGNAAYDGVLTEIDRFFTWYDLRFFAHQIPCMIDYPLALPVAEDLQGIDFINAYLGRLFWEDGFCRLFPEEEREKAWGRYQGAYKDLPLNLFEPLFQRALGEALVFGVAPNAEVPKHKVLAGLFRGCGTEGARALLHKAAVRLCNRHHIWDSARRKYYMAFAETLAPHALAAEGEGVARLFGY